MKWLTALLNVLVAFLQWLDNSDRSASSDTPSPPPTPEHPPTTARMLTPIPLNAESPRYHISLYLANGQALSRSRSTDEYCIRTDGNVYVKDKGKWVLLPDVVGLSFYKKSS